jgi:cytochrome c-type biogenesis protein CcmE
VIRWQGWVAVGVLAIGVAGVVLSIARRPAYTYRLSIEELRSRSAALADKRVRVSGSVVPNSLQRPVPAHEARFRLADHSGEIAIRYTNCGQLTERGACALPDTFCDAPHHSSHVTVQGTLDPTWTRIDAETLLVRLSPKAEFRDPRDGNSANFVPPCPDPLRN